MTGTSCAPSSSDGCCLVLVRQVEPISSSTTYLSSSSSFLPFFLLALHCPVSIHFSIQKQVGRGPPPHTDYPVGVAPAPESGRSAAPAPSSFLASPRLAQRYIPLPCFPFAALFLIPRSPLLVSSLAHNYNSIPRCHGFPFRKRALSPPLPACLLILLLSSLRARRYQSTRNPALISGRFSDATTVFISAVHHTFIIIPTPPRDERAAVRNAIRNPQRHRNP